MSDRAGPLGIQARHLMATVATIALLITACAAPTAPSAAPPSSPPTASPSPATAPEPTPVVGALGNAPVACLGLGESDCRGVAGQVATLIGAADPRIRYVQIGPFGCADGAGCPTTLDARPEGDVLIETAGGVLGFHVKATGGSLDVRAQEAFVIDLAPSSRPPLAPLPQPLTLGHCGLWSGVDVGGSWWDPVGVIDSDHGDAINASEGTFTPVGIDRATFTSRNGFVVQLVRRDGMKALPLCQ